MQMILVASNPAWLDAQAGLLRRTVPDVSVLATPDPLRAAQYGQSNPVDILIAQLYMRRMDGLQLSAFMRYDHPKIQVWLMGTAQDFNDCLEECDPFVHHLLLPVPEEALLNILHEHMH